MFDTEKGGHIEKQAVIYFLKNINKGEIKGNVVTALKSLKVNKHQNIDYDNFKKWCKNFPCILIPVFRIQTKIREKFLGQVICLTITSLRGSYKSILNKVSILQNIFHPGILAQTNGCISKRKRYFFGEKGKGKSFRRKTT